MKILYHLLVSNPIGTKIDSNNLIVSHYKIAFVYSGDKI